MNVSIVIPVYNVSAYIERCILSVMNQTFTGSMECLLIDDCSPDDSIHKAARLISTYKGGIEFKIIHHEKNKGLSGARNSGTMYATGDYVYYLDSDDEITPDCISLLFEQTMKHPGVEIVQGATKSIPEQVFYDINAFRGFDYIDNNHLLRILYYKAGKRIPANVWNKLVLRKFLIKNGLYNKEGLIHEDHHWSGFVFRKLSKVAFEYSETYIHYSTPNSIMTGSSEEKSHYHWGMLLTELVLSIDDDCAKLQLLRYTNDYAQRFCFMRDCRVYAKLSRILTRQLVKHKLYYLGCCCYLSWWFRFMPKGQPFRSLLRKYCERNMRKILLVEVDSLKMKYNEDEDCICPSV